MCCPFIPPSQPLLKTSNCLYKSLFYGGTRILFYVKRGVLRSLCSLQWLYLLNPSCVLFFIQEQRAEVFFFLRVFYFVGGLPAMVYEKGTRENVTLKTQASKRLYWRPCCSSEPVLVATEAIILCRKGNTSAWSSQQVALMDFTLPAIRLWITWNLKLF